MNLQIKNKLEKQDVFRLADAYRASYNTLSEGYKTPEEMKLYTKDYFLRKLEIFRKNQEEAPVFVALKDGKPVGFLRYSPIEEYYKTQKDGIAKTTEEGKLDGVEYKWDRKIFFDKDVQLNDKTAILNQIYIDPEYQKHGIGEALFQKAIPHMNKKYDNFIVELNSDNKGAKKVYNKVLTAKPVAKTEDLDHILSGIKYISPVTMVHTTTKDAITRLADRARIRKRVKEKMKGIKSI